MKAVKFMSKPNYVRDEEFFVIASLSWKFLLKLKMTIVIFESILMNIDVKIIDKKILSTFEIIEHYFKQNLLIKIK